MKNPLVRTTTAGILAGFAQTIKQLRDHAVQQEALASKYDDQIEALEIKADEADLESERAARAATKIESLLA